MHYDVVRVNSIKRRMANLFNTPLEKLADVYTKKKGDLCGNTRETRKPEMSGNYHKCLQS